MLQKDTKVEVNVLLFSEKTQETFINTSELSMFK